MSHYGVVYPEFWTGPTGRAIAKAGGRDARLAALYLVSCRNATMIGLFYVPFDVMRQETGITDRALVRALERLREPARFAAYDPVSECAWVFEMAKFRLGTARKPLDPDDNRVAHCRRLYGEVVENPFLGPFFDRYRKDLRLTNRRECADHHHISPLPSPLEAPSKPVTDTDVRTKIKSRDQRSGTGNSKITALSRGADLLKALVHREVQAGLAAGETDPADLTERVKVAAARARIAYGGTHKAVLDATVSTALRREARR